MNTEEESFLGLHQRLLEFSGIWNETNKSVVKEQIEQRFKSYVLKEWYISDIVIEGEKVLFKWTKRLTPLTDEEVNLKYGR